MARHIVMALSQFDSVRAKTRPSILGYARKEGLGHGMNELVPPTGIEPVFQP